MLGKTKNASPRCARHFARLIAFTACTALTMTAANLLADEYAGKQWPAGQLVSIDQIDHSAYDELLKKHVDENGFVNYQAWHGSQSDRQVLTSYLEQLSRADANQPASRQAKLAYWINAYNALTIEGILRVYPTDSIRNHTAKIFGYNIWKNLWLYQGTGKITLDKIEHEVLRKMDEPRIHFAIVCASIGCPRLLNRAYTADQLDSQLSINSKDFFSRSQNLKIDRASKTLKLSAILNWFGTDFGANTEAQLKFLKPYLPDAAAKLVEAGGYRTTFQDYSWKLNKQ